MPTTALAPISLAFSTMRSMAWRRLSSSSSVYWVTSPPAIDLNAAPIPLIAPMLRTIRPKQLPMYRSVRHSGKSKAVVIGMLSGTAPADRPCASGWYSLISKRLRRGRSVGYERGPVLRDDADLLRQRRAPRRPRLHDRHRRRGVSLAPPPRRRGPLPHRDGRVRAEEPTGRGGPRRLPPGAGRPQQPALPRRVGPARHRLR